MHTSQNSTVIFAGRVKSYCSVARRLSIACIMFAAVSATGVFKLDSSSCWASISAVIFRCIVLARADRPVCAAPSVAIHSIPLLRDSLEAMARSVDADLTTSCWTCEIGARELLFAPSACPRRRRDHLLRCCTGAAASLWDIVVLLIWLSIFISILYPLF